MYKRITFFYGCLVIILCQLWNYRVLSEQRPSQEKSDATYCSSCVLASDYGHLKPNCECWPLLSQGTFRMLNAFFFTAVLMPLLIKSETNSPSFLKCWVQPRNSIRIWKNRSCRSCCCTDHFCLISVVFHVSEWIKTWILSPSFIAFILRHK